MAFKDIRFPTEISYGAIGGPNFHTTLVTLDSGIQTANQDWSLARWEYEVSHAAKVPADWQALFAFFLAVHGRFDSFRFNDPLDYAATSSEGKFVQLTTLTFQMTKRYTFSGQTYDRKITKPISTATITGGSGASVAYSTGIVTVASGTPTAWAGSFDVHARFDTDSMRSTTISRSGASLIVGWQSIPIVEVKE